MNSPWTTNKYYGMTKYEIKQLWNKNGKSKKVHKCINYSKIIVLKYK